MTYIVSIQISTTRTLAAVHARLPLRAVPSTFATWTRCTGPPGPALLRWMGVFVYRGPALGGVRHWTEDEARLRADAFHLLDPGSSSGS
jgi:hypothetical protein